MCIKIVRLPRLFDLSLLAGHVPTRRPSPPAGRPRFLDLFPALRFLFVHELAQRPPITIEARVIPGDDWGQRTDESPRPFQATGWLSHCLPGTGCHGSGEGSELAQAMGFPAGACRARIAFPATNRTATRVCKRRGAGVQARTVQRCLGKFRASPRT
jgi:hypothetical protein